MPEDEQPGELGTTGAELGRDGVGGTRGDANPPPIRIRHDADDSQPVRGGGEPTHRVYVRASWAPAGHGGGSPKLSGGISVDHITGDPAPRGLNRPGQIYQLPQSEISARREARAAAMYPQSVVLLGEANQIEVRSPSGNNYDISPDLKTCDCPDFKKLDQSGYGKVICKHILIANMGLNDPANTNGLPWGTSKWAELAGTSERVPQFLCHSGLIPATMRHNVWIIDPIVGQVTVGVYAHLKWPYR